MKSHSSIPFPRPPAAARAILILKIITLNEPYFNAEKRNFPDIVSGRARKKRQFARGRRFVLPEYDESIMRLEKIAKNAGSLNFFRGKRKSLENKAFSRDWSRIRESNPPPRLGKPMYYRCTNPAYELFDRASRDDTGILRRQAASVPQRILFWLCQKLRCCASRPSGDGKMLAVARASSAWEADVLPMYESCIMVDIFDRFAILSSRAEKSNRFLSRIQNLRQEWQAAARGAPRNFGVFRQQPLK